MDPTPWRKQRLLVKDILVHAKKLGSDEIETHVVKIVDVSRKINGVGEAIKRVLTGPTPTRSPIDDRYDYDAREYHHASLYRTEIAQRRLEREQLARMQMMANQPGPMMVQPSYQSNGFPGQAWGGSPFVQYQDPSW
jgi:hypothetical protein